MLPNRRAESARVLFALIPANHRHQTSSQPPRPICPLHDLFATSAALRTGAQAPTTHLPTLHARAPRSLGLLRTNRRSPGGPGRLGSVEAVRRSRTPQESPQRGSSAPAGTVVGHIVSETFFFPWALLPSLCRFHVQLARPADRGYHSNLKMPPPLRLPLGQPQGMLPLARPVQKKLGRPGDDDRRARVAASCTNRQTGTWLEAAASPVPWWPPKDDLRYASGVRPLGEWTTASHSVTELRFRAVPHPRPRANRTGTRTTLLRRAPPTDAARLCALHTASSACVGTREARAGCVWPPRGQQRHTAQLTKRCHGTPGLCTLTAYLSKAMPCKSCTELQLHVSSPATLSSHQLYRAAAFSHRLRTKEPLSRPVSLL